MYSKISSLRTLLLIAGIMFYSILVLFLAPHSASSVEQTSPPARLSPTPAKQAVEAVRVVAELPVRFKIPAINVDAAVEYAGLASDGTLAVPKGPADVAWFNLGTRPGESGSAVISGHYGWKDGIPAVFDDLSMLRKGDKVYVVDETGTTTTFVVRELRTYGDTEVVADVFGSSDGGNHLNLITCKGVWNKTEKSYSKRLVVFTDKI